MAHALFIYLLICSYFFFLTATVRNENTLVNFMEKRLFKRFLIANIFKVCFA